MLLFMAVFVSFQSSPAHGWAKRQFLPEIHLPITWSEITNGYDPYRLVATSIVSEYVKNDPSSPSVINIPLDPDQSALNPPEGRFLGKYNLLARDTGYLIIPAAVILGLLYIAPQSVTN